MKKTLSVTLVLVLSVLVFTGCMVRIDEKGAVEPKESDAKVISPLPETLDINSLDNCTVAVSLDKGDAYVDDNGKMVMILDVYTYELYDMVDISNLKENDVIVRLGEEIKVNQLEKLDSGLVRINAGEENGGFDLISTDDTVYFEIGASDVKAYNKLGEVTLPVSDEFVYADESDIDADAKEYYPGDFLTDDAGIEYNFNPNNTSVVIENGKIIKMNKFYTP